ncbi:uncharacterized protein Dana_GF24544, isoform A [Drosophila ananassae]|uniref:Uncharacterized protein, isoform A n=1 Tax=Drosophila ananassae TaxID=7217 RepID=B3M480_DROAN|nr:uncharacterized protein LOC6507176 isoform X2 [Drosophila ananassae]EDV39350.1 uncharacterized protein Dana_GF24544, isoform A [Drosophila ananassae]
MNTWLRGSLVEMSRSNRHTDCSFIIEPESGVSKSFPCHRLIFSCASEVFDRMLYGDYNESTSGEVHLNDVDPDVFEKFRDYVYGYECEKLTHYDFDTLIRLCEFGNKYLVQSIEEDCVRELLNRKDTYDMGELLRLFQCAHRLNKKHMIDQVAWDLKCNFSGSLNHSGIYEFNADVFKHYIEVISGKLPEADRFRLMEMYLKYNGLDDGEYTCSEMAPVEGTGSQGDAEKAVPEMPAASGTQLQIRPSSIILSNEEEKRKYVSDLVGLIDFAKFSPKEFYEGPGKSSFLSLAQKYEYLYKIARKCVQAKEELQLKVSPATEQTPLLSDTRRVVTLGGTLIRDDPVSTVITSHHSPRSNRRYRNWSSHCEFGPAI